MHARMLNIQVPPERCHERLEFYEDVMKQAREQDGCDFSLLLGNEDTGEVVMMTLWSDEEKMEASRNALFAKLTPQCEFMRAAVPVRRQLGVHFRA